MFIPPDFMRPAGASGREEGALRARVWDASQPDFVYPEQATGLLRGGPVTGVCFSGGGNRAMVAAWGQLRGLVASGLIDSIDYISCVSGGSWAAAPFTYYSDGPQNDEELLAPMTPPERILISDLNRMSPYALGVGATESFMSRLIEEAVHVSMRLHIPNEVWLRAVGSTFFERFGLYDRSELSYFSLDEATVEDILARNPSLQGARFRTARNKTGDAKRPYLIISSTLMWPNDENLVHFEYSPLYAGSRCRLTVYDPPDNAEGQSKTLGGGFIETFAFGSEAPRRWPPEEACTPWSGAAGCVDVQPPEQPFPLAFASGTSSAAFAATGAGLAGGVPMVGSFLQQGPPIQRYWPIPAADGEARPEAEVFSFGDGGTLENLGVIALLLRKVENLVVFINTERRLDLAYDPSDPENNPPRIDQLDGGVAPLFGILPTNRNRPPTPNNQVFLTEDFERVVRALQDAKTDGGGSDGPWGPAIAVTSLEVQSNDWWGLAGGWTANVCWVYLDRISAWEQRLQPEVARLVDAGNRAGPKDKAPYWRFPNYRTMFQGGKLQLISMKVGEANLLADFTSWTAVNSKRAGLIRETLGK